MDSYRDHEVDDFVSDNFFIEWVFTPQPSSSEFWNNWIEQNPDRVNRLNRARNILLAIKVVPSEKHLSDNDVLNIINYIKERPTDFNQTEEITPKPYHINRIFKWYNIAASLLIFCIAGVSYYYLKTPVATHISNEALAGNSSGSDVARIHNKGNEQAYLQLSDGSIAILKTGAVLTYPKTFGGSKREVYLEGEAFFEVYKNPKKPFLVHAKNLVTKVLGTSFMVSATANKSFRVIVHTGKVLVYDTNTKSKKWVLLRPHQQTTFLTSTSQFRTDSITTPLALSAESADKLFAFKETPLSVIIKKFEQAYNVNIVYNEVKYGKATVTGDLSKLMLSDKIKFICKAINAKFEIDGGRIVII